MSDPEHRRTRDVARAASLLVDAVEGAPGASVESVDTAFGRAEVQADQHGADVSLPGRGVSVHVRFEG